MTIRESIDKYIAYGASRLSDNTLQRYQSNLNLFANWIGKSRELSTISNEDINQYQLVIKGYYTPKTQDNHANVLRGFFKHWYANRKTTVAWELIRGPRVPEKLPSFITEDQFRQIDNALDEDEYYQLTKKVIFHLLWNTGMRIGELLSLNIEDIRSTERFAYVLTEKRKKMRIVMWNERCHSLLLRYLGVRICLNQAPELFQTPTTNPRYQRRRMRLTSRSVQRWCKKIGRELGFPMNPHAFRHGRCHYIINKGGSRHHVQAVAGHSSITSSEVYTRLNFQEQRRIQERYLPNSA